MEQTQTLVRHAATWILLATLSVLHGCSRDTSPTDSTSITPPVEDTRLVGKWNLQSKATLENGHDITIDNDYDFRADGTFTNISQSKLLNGDTGEPFYTSTTNESGTWTVDGDTTCWTTPTAELSEFETFTELVTREMIEEGLAGDAPPECWTILSADESAVSLRRVAGGAAVTLNRQE